MSNTTRTTGWRPIPLPLKIIFVLLVLWAIGALMNLPNLMTNGLPLFGTFVFGVVAALVVLALDIIGPLGFLFATWMRKPWGPKWAFIYMGIFILNSIVAFFTVREVLGTAPVLIPAIVTAIFAGIIYWKRDYFRAG